MTMDQGLQGGNSTMRAFFAPFVMRIFELILGWENPRPKAVAIGRGMFCCAWLSNLPRNYQGHRIHYLCFRSGCLSWQRSPQEVGCPWLGKPA